MNCEKLQNPNCLCSDCVPELTSKVPYREAFQRGVEAGRRDVKQLRKELEEARQYGDDASDRAEKYYDEHIKSFEKAAKAEQERDELLLMVDIFNSCITTNLYPMVSSPCHAKVLELITNNDREPTAGDCDKSLQQHDNAVIERCAIAALEAQMNQAEGGIYKSAAVAIRALRKTGEGDE